MVDSAGTYYLQIMLKIGQEHGNCCESPATMPARSTEAAPMLAWRLFTTTAQVTSSLQGTG